MVSILGITVVLLAVMGTSVNHVSSTMSAVLFLLSFTVIKDWKKMFVSLEKLEKVFLLAFVFYTISGALSSYNVDDIDQFNKMFERYLRFSLIIPVYLLIIKKNQSLLNYLYAGAVLSGPFLLVIALNHFVQFPGEPAQGYYHHIIFGQLAMLNVGVMLALLLTKNMSRALRVVILLSMVCGVVTAVMSQARGVWLVFPVYMMIALYYAMRDKRISANNIVIFLLVIILLAIVTPIGDVIKERTDQAVSEVSRYYTEDQYATSLGQRLAMWSIAINVWEKQPLLGNGPGNFDDEIIALQEEGKFIGMEIHDSVHNIYFQSLVMSGIVGLLALLLAVIIMPAVLFFKKTEANKEGALTGFIIVVSFAVYGLSESWTLRLPAVSIFLVYMVVAASHIHVTRSLVKN